MDDMSPTSSKLDVTTPEKPKPPVKPGRYKEKLLKMPKGPEEMSKNATELYIPWEVPYRSAYQKKVLVNGVSDTLAVEDLTDYNHPTRFQAFVKDQCPKLERLTLHFLISKWDSNEDIVEEMNGIWGSCLLLPEDCRFSIQAEYVNLDVEECGPKTIDEAMKDSQARTTIMKYFRKLGEQKGRLIEFEDD